MKGITKKINSQKGGFLNSFRRLMAAGLPLMKNALTSLAKNTLVLLGLMTGASATNAAIKKKIFGSGHPSEVALIF